MYDALTERLAECGAENGYNAVVTETGGWTSHTFILARELGIPAVTGIRKLMRRIGPGDMLIVDAIYTHFANAGDPRDPAGRWQHQARGVGDGAHVLVGAIPPRELGGHRDAERRARARRSFGSGGRYRA